MLGAFVIAARKRRGLSQKTLARRAGIAASYLCAIEGHDIIPSDMVLMALAEALDLPRTALLALLADPKTLVRA